ncbi:phosphoribulokinase [Lutimaribacter marinistellae]|uniref:Phosphoribulokinase n=1 Tax=Lutimaribacter marinistellae TaxID=1820329 RepID=A0ABV7TF20_9RHOB
MRLTKLELLELIAEKAKGKARILIAIAGAPGSGKSTLAEELAAQLADAAVLPMDGFHRDNAELEQMGRLHRKGAPDTFDADGFAELVRSLRSEEEIGYPTFDRALDKTIPKGGQLAKAVRIVIVEGNYLLLDTPPWNRLAAEFDLTVGLEVPLSVLEKRLIRRWLDQGMSPEQAAARAGKNDMKNANFVIVKSVKPDVILSTDDDPH